MNLTELEKRIIDAEKKGQAWAELHEKWLQLDKDEKSFLAALKIQIRTARNGEKISDAELEMEARASEEFRTFISRLAIAKGAELSAKVKYDNAIAWHEACRTSESTKRVEMQFLRGQT